MYNDKNLTCADCGQEFVFTASRAGLLRTAWVHRAAPLPVVPSQPQGCPERERRWRRQQLRQLRRRRRLLGRRRLQLRRRRWRRWLQRRWRWRRLRPRPRSPRDVHRNLLVLRQGCPGPVPPDQRQARLLLRLLPQPARWQLLLTHPLGAGPIGGPAEPPRFLDPGCQPTRVVQFPAGGAWRRADPVKWPTDCRLGPQRALPSPDSGHARQPLRPPSERLGDVWTASRLGLAITRRPLVGMAGPQRPITDPVGTGVADTRAPACAGPRRWSAAQARSASSEGRQAGIRGPHPCRREPAARALRRDPAGRRPLSSVACRLAAAIAGGAARRARLVADYGYSGRTCAPCVVQAIDVVGVGEPDRAPARHRVDEVRAGTAPSPRPRSRASAGNERRRSRSSEPSDTSRVDEDHERRRPGPRAAPRSAGSRASSRRRSRPRARSGTPRDRPPDRARRPRPARQRPRRPSRPPRAPARHEHRPRAPFSSRRDDDRRPLAGRAPAARSCRRSARSPTVRGSTPPVRRATTTPHRIDRREVQRPRGGTWPLRHECSGRESSTGRGPWRWRIGASGCRRGGSRRKRSAPVRSGSSAASGC